MDKVETENVELRKLLNAVVGTWTDEKQMAGILCLHDKLGNGSKLPTKIRTDVFRFLFSAESTFLATISQYSVSVTPGEPVVWDSAPINPGGHFNTILGMYTAPVHGYYT